MMTLSRITSKSFFTLLFLLCSPYSSHGGEVNYEYAKQNIAASNKAIDLIIERFSPNFPNDKKFLLSKEKIKIRLNADFNAFSNYQDKTIIIPAQFILELHAQIMGIFPVLKNPALIDQYNQWIKYLSERSIKAKEKFEKGETISDDEPVISFWSYAGLPPQQLSDAEETQLESMMLNSLALVIGHELGHLALEHKPYKLISSKKSRMQEYAADKFSADLLSKSGFSVLPGLSTFYSRFIVNEATYKNLDHDLDTHPRPECRFYLIGKNELKKVTTQDRENFSKSSGMKYEDFESYMNTLGKECKSI